MPDLTDDEKAMLDFAGRFYKQAGNQHDAVRLEFGLTVTRFWQLVNQLVDTNEALAYDPALVRRLQRIRDARGSGRVARANLLRGA